MVWKSIIVFLLIMLTAVSIQAATCGSEPSFHSCQDEALSIEEIPIILVAVQPLSGNVLEQACRDHAGRALRDSQEWDRLGCSAKLHLTSQVFSLDYNTHLSRCKGTLGTAIRDDQKGRENLLAKCRGTAPPPPPTPPSPPSTPPSPPSSAGRRSGSSRSSARRTGPRSRAWVSRKAGSRPIRTRRSAPGRQAAAWSRSSCA